MGTNPDETRDELDESGGPDKSDEIRPEIGARRTK
jgi:hypothetical protein